jgi:alanine racemase
VACIDGSALTHNLARVRQLTPGSRVLAVLKADAYGHGLLRCASALAGADGFAVARLSEALQLREAGFCQRLLLLPGVFSNDELALAATRDIDVAVTTAEQLSLLQQADPAHAVTVWLKVDSGMHRLGFPPEEVPRVHRLLRRTAAVRGNVNLMTHLADADSPALGVTPSQIRCFEACTRDLVGERSIGNSAGVIAWPAARSDWVRPGIMLYGISPLSGERGAQRGLRAVMRLCAPLISVKRIPAGAAVGYGGAWVAPEETTLGAVALGYADGFPRSAPSGVPVRIHAHDVPLAGRVSMDSITVDLRGVPQARAGDMVELWGPAAPLERLAARCQTIPYELLCRVGSRVPRVSVEEAGAIGQGVSVACCT